uniref:DUF7516 domain-containing protein n=1 Tax=Panagrolaimus davidi TaxID=227884 RepID=A0A914PVA6_9BILA
MDDSSFDRSLLYPPGFCPIAYEQYLASLKPSTTDNKGFKNVELKYTLVEAQLRILSCCRDLGISTTNEIKYHQVQKAYQLKFGIPLNKEEINELFFCKKASTALKENVQDFLVVVEDKDGGITLRLKEDSEDYIKNMEDSYNGKTFPSLTSEEVHEILYPTQCENYGQTNRTFYGGGNYGSTDRNFYGPAGRLIVPRQRTNRQPQRSDNFQSGYHPPPQRLDDVQAPSRSSRILEQQRFDNPQSSYQAPSRGFHLPEPQSSHPQRPLQSSNATGSKNSSAAPAPINIQSFAVEIVSVNKKNKLKLKKYKSTKAEERQKAKLVRFENAKKRFEGYLSEALEEFEADYEKIKEERGGTITKELQDEYDMKVKHLQDLHAGQIELLRKGIIEGKWDD